MNTEHLLEALRGPACYPHAVHDVQVVQTHLSIVCLAGNFVYKLKKSRKLPFVDFSPLMARRGFCRDEVRLNRRLCPTTYLGTCALRRGPAGLRFAAIGDDDGPADLDVAVVMRRLPADRMLDVLLHARAVTVAEIEALARQIAAFHASTERSAAVLAAGDPHRLAAFARANFTELAALPGHGLPVPLLAALAKATDAAFTRLLPRLVLRAVRGHVVDGHGDLHARNVCMTDPPTVYDCIEFAAAFRCGDVATENAFLAMDLRYRGAPDLAAAYVRAYVAASGDVDQPQLLGPLIAYRAMVRAKVAALAAAEPELPTADRTGARGSSLRHLLLAAAVTVEAQGPLWLIVCGPPASGKSVLCRQLVESAHWSHVDTDTVRKELAGLPPTQRATTAHYTPQFSDRTYATVLARAATATAAGAAVVLLDGNFPSPQRRSAAIAAARTAGARPIVAFVDVDAATAQARAAHRAEDPASVSDAGPEQAASLRAKFAPPTSDEVFVLIVLDGTRPPGDLCASLLAAVLDAQQR